jgi:hypothetical protein
MLEKDVKKELNKFLKAAGCYWHMHVPVGYGRTTIDYLGCYRGHFFGIETKSKGKTTTCMQDKIIKEIEAAGGAAWVEDSLGLETTLARFSMIEEMMY